VRSTSRELRARSALLLRRWANWWRIVRRWRHGPEHLLPVCAYCSRVRDQDGDWVEIPSAVARRFHLDSGPQVTHGVCPACLAKLDSSSR
jgi:hypothetical protein